MDLFQKLKREITDMCHMLVCDVTSDSIRHVTDVFSMCDTCRVGDMLLGQVFTVRNMLQSSLRCMTNMFDTIYHRYNVDRLYMYDRTVVDMLRTM